MTSRNSNKEVLDWDELEPEDQKRAEELLNELNNLFVKYSKKEEPACEDSTLDD